MNEIQCVGEYYFEKVEVETNLFLQAKLDMMSASSKIYDRLLASCIGKLNKNFIKYICTNYINAAFCFKNPQKLG
jgi:hypothetical protein